MKASEVLTGAIEALNEFGWNQGDYGNQERGLCAIGAMDYGAGYRNPKIGNFDADAYVTAKQYMNTVVGGNAHSGVSIWNDASGRTKEEVIAALTRARELALADGQ